MGQVRSGTCHHGAVLEQCLKGGPHGSELCWRSAGRAAGCGKATRDHLGKVDVLWEAAKWQKVALEEWQKQSVMD